MNAPPPEHQPFMPIADLLGEALSLYGRDAPMFAGIGFVTALVGNLLLLVPLQTPVLVFTWGLVVFAMVIGWQAPIWMMAFMARRGPLPEAKLATIMVGVNEFMRKIFVVALVFGAGVGALLLIAVFAEMLTLPASIIFIYLATRLSLACPALVVERCMPMQAFVSSWRLVEGRWWRTFIVQLPVVLFAIFTAFIAQAVAVAAAPQEELASALLGAIALGVSAPLFALVATALYEEYLVRPRPNGTGAAKEEPEAGE